MFFSPSCMIFVQPACEFRGRSQCLLSKFRHSAIFCDSISRCPLEWWDLGGELCKDQARSLVGWLGGFCCNSWERVCRLLWCLVLYKHYCLLIIVDYWTGSGGWNHGADLLGSWMLFPRASARVTPELPGPKPSPLRPPPSCPPRPHCWVVASHSLLTTVLPLRTLEGKISSRFIKWSDD